MHPQVWKVSGHYDLFHDYMVDCREIEEAVTAHDQVRGRWVQVEEPDGSSSLTSTEAPKRMRRGLSNTSAMKFFNLRGKDADDLKWDGDVVSLDYGRRSSRGPRPRMRTSSAR